MNKCLHIHHRFPRKLLAAGAAAALVLAGCGSDDAEERRHHRQQRMPRPTHRSNHCDTSRSHRCRDDRRHRSASGHRRTPTRRRTRRSTRHRCETWIEADNLIELDQTVPTGQATPDEANASLDEAIAAADERDRGAAHRLPDGAAARSSTIPKANRATSSSVSTRRCHRMGGELLTSKRSTFTPRNTTSSGCPRSSPPATTSSTSERRQRGPRDLGVARINDDVTLSVDELLALPEDESDTKVSRRRNVRHAGRRATSVRWTLAEPGRVRRRLLRADRHVGDAEGDGPPHFTQGMVHEFTVT